MGGGTAVVQVRATDRDIGINSVLSYYITGGNEDTTFRMDRISGEIATRPAPPDRERQSFYHLVVTVEDEGTPTLSVSDRGRLLGEEGGGGTALLSVPWDEMGRSGMPRASEFATTPLSCLESFSL